MMDPGTSTSAADPSSASPAASRWAAAVSQRYQHLLDKSVPHVSRRWLVTLAVACVYLVRVYFLQGFYIVTYGLGIYMLNLLIGFLSPQVDPEFQDLADGGGPSLPTRGSDEFRPFVRRLPEFKCCVYRRICICFQDSNFDPLIALAPVRELLDIKIDFLLVLDGYLLEIFFLSLDGRLQITWAFVIAFMMTFFSVFDVPVFWPVLLFYWVMLFTLTMRRQIMLMVKYRYVPFSLGKRRYDGKKASSTDTASLPRD